MSVIYNSVSSSSHKSKFGIESHAGIFGIQNFHKLALGKITPKITKNDKRTENNRQRGGWMVNL